MDSLGLTFLKLGGSLITDKDTPHSSRPDVLARLANEIVQARAEHPDLPLILGHGSGSFGHVPAQKYGTRQGISSPQGWQGFVEVWREARALNHIVVEALNASGLPVLAFPPSAAVIAREGKPVRWDLAPLQAALEARLIPLVNGDVIFDEKIGGTILSTEDLFLFLAQRLHPRRILLAGQEEGVWADFPSRTHLIPRISEINFPQIATQISGSASVDVTGGMLEKVNSMLALSDYEQKCNSPSDFYAMIFSGMIEGNVKRALCGEQIGTVIY